MTISTVVGGDALARGLRNEFGNTWKRRYNGIKDKLKSCMEFGIPSDKFEEIFGYFESAPYPRRRPWGEEVPTKPFRARNFKVQNKAWDIAVEWHKHHRTFDQLRQLEQQARQAGENYGTLDERVFFQFLTGASDVTLLDVIPSAPDGAVLYATTAGGSDRFGISGGNIEPGTGVLTAAAIRTDFFNGVERFARFQDPEGQPAMDAGVIDQGLMIFFNVTNSQVFREAFWQTYTFQKSTGTSTSDTSSAAAVTNVILDSGMKVTLCPTQRITDDDWFIFLTGFEPKPIFQMVAQPLEEHIEVEDNSDRSRRVKIEGIYWEAVHGYGGNLPLGTVKVNN